MKRIRVGKPRIRRKRAWTEDPPTGPRDPDVVRAKALARARPAGSSRASQAQQANTSGPGAGTWPSGRAAHRGARAAGDRSSVRRKPHAVAVHSAVTAGWTGQDDKARLRTTAVHN